MAQDRSMKGWLIMTVTHLKGIARNVDEALNGPLFQKLSPNLWPALLELSTDDPNDGLVDRYLEEFEDTARFLDITGSDVHTVCRILLATFMDTEHEVQWHKLKAALKARAEERGTLLEMCSGILQEVEDSEDGGHLRDALHNWAEAVLAADVPPDVHEMNMISGGNSDGQLTEALLTTCCRLEVEREGETFAVTRFLALIDEAEETEEERPNPYEGLFGFSADDEKNFRNN
jgi:hypothetical protein